MIKHISLFFLPYLVGFIGISQVTFEDSIKVEKWSNEARSTFSKDLKAALILCDKAIELAKGDSTLITKPLTAKALIYFQVGEKEKSLGVMDQLIEITEKSGNLAGLSSAYRNLGQIEYYTGDYEKALTAYIKANNVYKKYGEYDANPNLLLNIADLQLTLQDVKKAKKTYKEALMLAGYWGGELVAEVETRLAKVYLQEKNLDSALYLANKANDYYKSINKKVLYNSPESVLAEIYEKQQKPKQALEILEERIKIFEQNGDERSYAQVALRLGILYSETNKLDLAAKYFLESYKINKKLKDPSIADNANMLAYVYDRKGDYAKALIYYKEYMEYYKGFLNEKKLEQVNDLQVKYDTEKKERENEKLGYELALSTKNQEIIKQDLKQRNYLIIGVSIVLLLVLLLGLLLWNRRRVAYSNRMLKLEQNLLKTQMNPHFISNALMSLQGFIYENNMKEAGEYLTKIAKLTRQVLENSRKESVTLEEEIETLKNYLLVQQTRFNNFDFELNVSEDIDVEEVEVTPMLTQPLVENAIEHGISNIDYRGRVVVHYSINEQKKLQILVSDNGRGIQTKSSKEGHTSISSLIIQERLMNLAEFYKQKLDFTISENPQDENGEKGTKVLLTLPTHLQ